MEPPKSTDDITTTAYIPSDNVVALWNKIEALERLWQLEDESILHQAKKDKIAIHGYCYAAWNPLFKHLIKIGATTRSPYIRLRELSGAGMPEPFQLVTSIACADPFAMETRIHNHFAHVRTYGPRKEFFELSWDETMAYFEEMTPVAMTDFTKEKRRLDKERANEYAQKRTRNTPWIGKPH
jgi:hypothetical protein